MDTNVLFYSMNLDCEENEAAREFISSLTNRKDVVLCDLVLVELYILLRNPAVIPNPLSAKRAAAACLQWRSNPKWRIVESAPVMDKVWQNAKKKSFPRRRIIDTRLALTLLHHGVTEFATRNKKDFLAFGFERVFNPL